MKSLKIVPENAELSAFPGPFHRLGRRKCRIQRLTKHFGAGNAVSLTFQNILALDTAYPAPHKTFWLWIQPILNLWKHFDARYGVSLTFRNVLKLDTTYPEPFEIFWRWIRRI